MNKFKTSQPKNSPKFKNKQAGLKKFVLIKNVYRTFCVLVKGFLPVSDAAKQAVKFSLDFNGAITHNPKCHASMMQGVEAHCRANPQATKAVFIRKLDKPSYRTLRGGLYGRCLR